jgi:hypothetical protein
VIRNKGSYRPERPRQGARNSKKGRRTKKEKGRRPQKEKGDQQTTVTSITAGRETPHAEK